MVGADASSRTLHQRRSLPSRFSRVVVRGVVRVVEDGLRESWSAVGWNVRNDSRVDGFVVFRASVVRFVQEEQKRPGKIEQGFLVGGVGIGDVEFSRAGLLQRRFVVYGSHESVVFIASIDCVHAVY